MHLQHKNNSLEKGLPSHIHKHGISALAHARNNQPVVNELSPQETTSSKTTNSIFGEDGFTFGDIIDIINPLQHIPIVNNIYRKITGDTIAPAMEIAGGALFGGPIGAAISAVTTAIKSQFQSDVKSIDPGSPSNDGPANSSTAIANNTPAEKIISAEDYYAQEKSDIKQTDYSTTPPNIIHKDILNSEKIIQRHNDNLSLNTLHHSQASQWSDAIMNLVYKDTERYSDAIPSKDTSEKKVDIIIGSTADAG